MFLVNIFAVLDLISQEMLSSCWCLWQFSLQQQWRLYTYNSNFRAETYQSQFVHIILEDTVCCTVSPRNMFVLRGNKVQLHNKHSWIDHHCVTPCTHSSLPKRTLTCINLTTLKHLESWPPVPKGFSFIQLKPGSHFLHTTMLSLHLQILTWDHVRSVY